MPIASSPTTSRPLFIPTVREKALADLLLGFSQEQEKLKEKEPVPPPKKRKILPAPGMEISELQKKLEEDYKKKEERMREDAMMEVSKKQKLMDDLYYLKKQELMREHGVAVSVIESRAEQKFEEMENLKNQEYDDLLKEKEEWEREYHVLSVKREKSERVNRMQESIIKKQSALIEEQKAKMEEMVDEYDQLADTMDAMQDKREEEKEQAEVEFDQILLDEINNSKQIIRQLEMVKKDLAEAEAYIDKHCPKIVLIE